MNMLQLAALAAVTGGTCKSAVQLLPEDGTVYYGSLPGSGLLLIVRWRLRQDPEEKRL